MKKIALLPVAALLMLGACSNDEPVVRPVPNDPVQTVPSVADQITLNAPALENVAEEGTYFRASYANGQEIVYAFAATSTSRTATVKKIQGTSADVVIPASVVYGDYTYTVNCLDLMVEGISDNVTSLTISNTARYMVENSSYVSMSNEYFRAQMERGNKVEKIELEDGFPRLCSINGAVYSADMLTLVCVPRGYKGTMTIAENTQHIDPRALYYCSQIDVLTIPAGVLDIGDEAVVFNDNLLLINCLATTAPNAVAGSFGTYAHNGVLRIPTGAEEAYKFAKPEIELPIEPVEPELPGDDATDEEWEAYDQAYAEWDEAMGVYYQKMEEYTTANDYYDNHAGWALFKNIEAVIF